MKDYLKWSVLYHLDSIGKIKPILDYDIKIENAFHVISSLTRLLLMNDFDLTLTAEDSYTAFEEFYYNQLPKTNSRINEKLPEIKKCIEDIKNSPSDFSKPHARLDKRLRESELKKEQTLEAYFETGRSKNIKIVPYATEAILDLEKMNCKVGINTGSLKPVIEEISRRKIGIEMSNIAASEFYFDENGYFQGSWLNLGINKVRSMGNYFLPEAYCNFSFLANASKPWIVYTTDDLSPFEQPLVAKLGSLLGTVLFVGKDYEKHGKDYEYVLNVPGLRKDFRRIKPYLTLLRRASVFPFLHKPEEADKIIRLAEEIKFSSYESAEELLEKIQEFVSLEMLHPALTTRIEERCRELKRKLSEKTLKEDEVKELVKIMEAFDPAFHTKEERKEELRRIILS